MGSGIKLSPLLKKWAEFQSFFRFRFRRRLVLALGAGHVITLGLAVFLGQVPEPATGAFLVHRFVPAGVFAVGVAAAGVEILTTLAAALGQLAGAARLGAGHPGGDGFYVLALGVIGTGVEFSEPAPFDYHRTLAVGALQVCLFLQGFFHL